MASLSATATISGVSSTTSGILNTGEAPSPTTVISAQSSTVTINQRMSAPVEQELEKDLDPLVEELGGKITQAVDPTRSKPRDVNIIKTLSAMMKKGVSLLMKYNDSGNSTVDFFNATDGLVLVMKRFDCLEERSASLPDRADKSIGKALTKFSDYVSAKFDCPRIVKNDTHPKSRKRRDVKIEVTMDFSAEDEDGGDFHEFQLLHRQHSRIRRSAAVYCGGPLSCHVQRFETILVIKNRTFNSSLSDTTSGYFKELTRQIGETLESTLESTYLMVEGVHTFTFSDTSGNVQAKFYFDVKRPDVNGPILVDSDVTGALKNASVNSTLDQFDVDTAAFQAVHKIVVDGNYTQWTDWTACDDKFDTKRTRVCEGAQNGGKCYGDAKETKKCDCVYNETQELEEFHLEKDKKCFYDYMEFFDGDTANHQIGDRLCGRQGPRTIESSGQKLRIVFNADKSENFSGFRAVWQTPKIKKKVIEYVEQYVTSLVMIYTPTVNDTQYPLGTATTCPADSRTNDKECIFEDTVFIISRLISAHIDRSLPLDGDNRIVVNFQHIMNEKLFPAIYNGDKQCVRWNENAKLQSPGGWSRGGCTVLKTNITHTSCACDQQGLFAVVGKEKSESHKLRLLANTYIGIGISFFILLLAIAHIVWKIEIHGGEVMRINMCAAIIVMQSVFLIGAHVKAQQTLCGFLAFAVYFSVLAEFCWLLLHGLRIHGKIKKIFASNLNIEIVYVVIGWGLPTLLALIAIGVQIDLKNPDDVCWEAAAGSAMWGYAGPVIIIAVFNVAVLLKLLIPTEDVKNGYDYEEMRFRVIKDAIFLACFGLTCTFAYQAVEEERFTEQYFLSVFVVLQAIAMFVFGREGRKDFIKRVEDPQPDEGPANTQADAEEEPENIYENIEDVKPETDLGEGHVKRPRKRNAPNKQPEKITVNTLKNLNIYKEGGQYVIEA
ncbi:hypothetical protein OS493_023088 [Desmophyllum pertusum]|uniref:Uncharacterized protein n=1 Tax=Desmophyllum pertusum TaxID=174260 RepID=A0A9W9YYI7_9CNID|nr:hypothetical protein OS493_023088 [Desmophyllum pertusum]